RPEELGRLADRQLADLVDVPATYGDRQRLRPQPRAVARRTRHLPHVALDLLAAAVAVGLRVPALQPGDDPLEAGGVGALPSVSVAVRDPHLGLAGAVQHCLL